MKRTWRHSAAAALMAILATAAAHHSCSGESAGEARPLPILMFHAVEGESTDRFTVREDHFLGMLDALSRSGYETVLPSDLLAGKAPLPPKPVMLTFDDAHLSHWEVVAPELEERSFRGVFAVPSSYPGSREAPLPAMSWAEVIALRDAGHEIAGHGGRHANLAVIPDAPEDLRETVRIFKDRLGEIPKSFFYPKGQFRPGTEELVTAAGYRMAFTTIDEVETWPPRDILHLRRIGVVGGKDSVVYRGDRKSFLLTKIDPGAAVPQVKIESLSLDGDGGATIALTCAGIPPGEGAWLQLLRLDDPRALPAPFLNARFLPSPSGSRNWRLPAPRSEGRWVARLWDGRGGFAWAERIFDNVDTSGEGGEPVR